MLHASKGTVEAMLSLRTLDVVRVLIIHCMYFVCVLSAIDRKHRRHAIFSRCSVLQSIELNRSPVVPGLEHYPHPIRYGTIGVSTASTDRVHSAVSISPSEVVDIYRTDHQHY